MHLNDRTKFADALYYMRGRGIDRLLGHRIVGHRSGPILYYSAHSPTMEQGREAALFYIIRIDSRL